MAYNYPRQFRVSGRFNPVMEDILQREMEKERIREEVRAEERGIRWRQELELEVRREMAMERYHLGQGGMMMSQSPVMWRRDDGYGFDERIGMGRGIGMVGGSGEGVVVRRQQPFGVRQTRLLPETGVRGGLVFQQRAEGVRQGEERQPYPLPRTGGVNVFQRRAEGVHLGGERGADTEEVVGRRVFGLRGRNLSPEINRRAVVRERLVPAAGTETERRGDNGEEVGEGSETKQVIVVQPPTDSAVRKRKINSNFIIDFSNKKKVPTNEWICAICQVTVTSENGLTEHLNGKKHKSKEACQRGNSVGSSSKLSAKAEMPNMLKDTKASHTQKKRYPFWCEVCRVRCNSQKVLDLHKYGKKHVERNTPGKWEIGGSGKVEVAKMVEGHATDKNSAGAVDSEVNKVEEVKKTEEQHPEKEDMKIDVKGGNFAETTKVIATMDSLENVDSEINRGEEIKKTKEQHLEKGDMEIDVKGEIVAETAKKVIVTKEEIHLNFDLNEVGIEEDANADGNPERTLIEEYIEDVDVEANEKEGGGEVDVDDEVDEVDDQVSEKEEMSGQSDGEDEATEEGSVATVADVEDDVMNGEYEAAERI